VAVPLQGGTIVHVAADEVRPVPPQEVTSLGKAHLGGMVEVFYRGRWWPALMCTVKDSALAVMCEGECCMVQITV
jgi:hypothetical protein